ncbi:MAG: helix-turn-helix transcriptional regulator [Porphyromonadaceae bacterium]|nr:helix-turn-helix transcriptional regulator [Porphyromonadaceae bacterium]
MAEIKFPALRGKMAERGLKQSDLSKVLNIHETSFYKKINGVTEWKFYEIVSLMDYFNSDFNELFRK